MANPQKENGYVSIANEIMDALVKITLTDSNRRVLDTIIRKTYGYNKKEDSISISQIEEYTLLSRRTIIYAIQNLESMKIIKVARTNYKTNIIGFNKNYDQWVVQNFAPQVVSNRLRNKLSGAKLRNDFALVQSYVKNDPKVVQNYSKSSAKSLHPQKTTKDIIHKDRRKFLDFVFLSDDEYKKLIDKYGQQLADEKIEILNEGIGSKGYKYSSHYHTILSWDRREKKKELTPKKTIAQESAEIAYEQLKKEGFFDEEKNIQSKPD